MSKTEKARAEFVTAFDGDAPAYNRDGAYSESVKIELAVKKLRADIEAFAATLAECDYAPQDAIRVGYTLSPGKPMDALSDAVQAAVDAFEWNLNGEAHDFMCAVLADEAAPKGLTMAKEVLA